MYNVCLAVMAQDKFFDMMKHARWFFSDGELGLYTAFLSFLTQAWRGFDFVRGFLDYCQYRLNVTQDERSLRGDSKTQSIFDCANRADAEIWLTDIIQQWPENVRVYFMKAAEKGRRTPRLSNRRGKEAGRLTDSEWQGCKTFYPKQ